MPLLEELLDPIPGDCPSGRSLRYERIYDQIKEARIEEDDTLPLGAWERTVKRADYRLVIKLTTEALASKSKDLQLAAWLGEARIKLEGAAALGPVLEMLLRLQETFWETVFPEVEDADAGLRAVPLQWAANRYAALVYSFPLARSNVNFMNYKTARAMGAEAEVAGNEARRKARAEAIARGQMTTEEVDQAIAESPKSFYVSLEEALREGLDRLESLAVFCEERYGEDGPSFRRLRESMEEVHNLVQGQLNEKRRLEPDPVAVLDVPMSREPERQLSVSAMPISVPAEPTFAPPMASIAAEPLVAMPMVAGTLSGGWEEAESSVCALARYMARQRPGSAVPYLIQTGIRWGEIRREMPRPPRTLMEAPAASDRELLRQAASEKRWSDVLERSMVLVGEPAGRAWLDVQRWLWEATIQLGFRAFAEMVVRSVRELLVDFPELPEWTLVDDSPAADAETREWIRAEVLVVAGRVEAPTYAGLFEEEAPAPFVPPPPPVVATSLAASSQAVSYAAALKEDGREDVLSLATAMADAGQLREATRLLARDAASQPIGRLRYRRRLELAQLCVSGGSGSVAVPVLRELLAEIDERKLETWEEFDMITRPMILMLQCMGRPEEAEDRDRLLARLSRIDPTATLEILP